MTFLKISFKFATALEVKNAENRSNCWFPSTRAHQFLSYHLLQVHHLHILNSRPTLKERSLVCAILTIWQTLQPTFTRLLENTLDCSIFSCRFFLSIIYLYLSFSSPVFNANVKFWEPKSSRSGIASTHTFTAKKETGNRKLDKITQYPVSDWLRVKGPRPEPFE